MRTKESNFSVMKQKLLFAYLKIVQKIVSAQMRHYAYFLGRYYENDLFQSINDAVSKRTFFNLSRPIKNVLISHRVPWVREQMARRPDLSDEQILKLATDEFFSVRAALSINPRTPPDLVKKLREDKEVLYWIPRLHEPPEDIVWEIIKNADIGDK